MTSNLLMSALMSVLIGGASRQAGINTINHPPQITAESRLVVRPAPDLAYSSCAFDVSDGAVSLTLTQSTTYASLSLFADDTVNFFALNDRDVRGAETQIVIVRVGDRSTIIPPGAIRVEAPSNRGLALWRRVIPSPDAWPVIDEKRREVACGPLAS
ncbi:MAG: DUF1254 domain-containing protein [Alphaproteobacteria bacterium]